MQTKWTQSLGIIALAAGCLLTGCLTDGGGKSNAASDAKTPSDATAYTSPEGLNTILADTGFTASNRVLTTILSVPAVNNDPNTAASWSGAFAGAEQAVLKADDQILVIARSRDQDQTRYQFSAQTRAWQDVSDKRATGWRQIWFRGSAKDFLRTVQADRDSRAALTDALNKPLGEGSFPLQISTAAMRTNLVEIGLSTLEEHLRTTHADGRPCTPEIRVYVRPAGSAL